MSVDPHAEPEPIQDDVDQVDPSYLPDTDDDPED